MVTLSKAPQNGVKDIEEAEEDIRDCLRSIIDNTADGIITTDLEGRVSLWNKAAERIYGWGKEEVIEKKIPTVPSNLRHELEEIVERVSQGESIPNFETLRMHRDGQLINVSITFSPLLDTDGDSIGICEITKDIVERKRLEEQLIESEKMALMGTITANVAHSLGSIITNFIASSSGNLDEFNKLRFLEELGELVEEATDINKLRKGYQKLKKKHEYVRSKYLWELDELFEESDLTQIKENFQNIKAKFISSIYSRMEFYSKVLLEQGELMDMNVKRLLSFARKNEPKRSSVDLNYIVQTSVELLRNHEREGIKFIEDYDPDLPTVFVDPHEVLEAIINLLLNAIQSIPDSGKLKYGTRPSKDGDFVEFFVSDSGRGIPKNIMDKIFEPFFTTRDTGTGLGLSRSLEIAKDYNGTIDFKSEFGKGSTFILKLPQQGGQNGVN
ncbi:MAG: PAS domain S-box protein [Halobacteriota archaeon]|nr:PAS domain S-box protein [Halobacteriota archaeon]